MEENTQIEQPEESKSFSIRRNFKRLSSAIIFGSRTTQRRRATYFEVTTDDLYGERDKGNVTSIGACAMAAAFIGITGVFDHDGTTIQETLRQQFTKIMDWRGECPLYKKVDARYAAGCYIHNKDMASMIMHLMDDHHWSRKRIAAFVARIETELGYAQELHFSVAHTLTTETMTAAKLVNDDEAGAQLISLEVELEAAQASVKWFEDPPNYWATRFDSSYKAMMLNHARQYLSYIEKRVDELRQPITYPTDLVAEDMVNV